MTAQNRLAADHLSSGQLARVRGSVRARRMALFAVCLTMFSELLNNALLNIAFPTILTAFHASAQAAQWIITGYALGFGSALLLAGRLSDYLGHRLVFAAGMAGFVIASLCCALSANIAQLVVSRVLQGVACSLTAPQIMAFMQILFTPEERARKTPYIGMASAAASTLGPLLGGGILIANIAGLGWRTVFALDAVVGSAALAAGLLFLPGGTACDRRGVDGVGAALFAAATASFMIALTWMEQWSSRPWLAVGLMISGGLVLVGWRHLYVRTHRGLPAIIAPQILRDGRLRLGALITVCFAMGNASYLLVFNVLLQNERGASAVQAGMMHLPYSLGGLLGMTVIARRLLVRHGRWVLVVGSTMVVVSGGAVLMLLSMHERAMTWTIPATAMLGVGVGMTSGCIGPVSLAWANARYAGMSAAVLRVGQQIGWALGGALIVRPYVNGSSRGLVLADGAQALAVMMPLTAVMLIAIVCALRLPEPLFPSADVRS